MRIDRIIWDLDDDPDGNVQHIAENGLTPEEVEQILLQAEEIGTSDSSGLPMVFGLAGTGSYIGVVFQIVEKIPFSVRVVTAFETDF